MFGYIAPMIILTLSFTCLDLFTWRGSSTKSARLATLNNKITDSRYTIYIRYCVMDLEVSKKSIS